MTTNTDHASPFPNARNFDPSAARHLTTRKLAIANAVKDACRNGSAGHVGWLYGPANAEHRIRIMAAIHGHKLPKAKCGINAVMAALYAVFPVHAYSCTADRERKLGDLIETAAATPPEGKFTLRIFTDDMGSFSQPGCSSIDDALWHVNSAREHDALDPIDMDTLQSLFARTNKGWAKMVPQS